MTKQRGSCILLILHAVLTSGCGSSLPEFQPNALKATDSQLTPSHEQRIKKVLTDLFGTPDEPRVPEQVDLDIDKLRMASGEAGYEDRGAEQFLQRGLYRQHCASCHGVTGDGMGPSAGMMVAYPRDFRPGVFKWKSTYREAKPTDQDIERVLERGVPGTAMPSFALLNQTQRDSLVEYVKYLAMRGELESKLVEATEIDPEFDPAGNPEDEDLVAKFIELIKGSWREADSRIVQPDTTAMPNEERSDEQIADSIAAGRDLFLSSRTKCVDCHGQDGIGGELEELDEWNSSIADFNQRTEALAASIERRQHASATPGGVLVTDRQMLDRRRDAPDSQMPPRAARARDLASGVYSGGGEPLDIFRRLHQGVAGTPMPGVGSPRSGAPGALSEQEIWQLVDYVRSLTSKVDTSD